MRHHKQFTAEINRILYRRRLQNRLPDARGVSAMPSQPATSRRINSASLFGTAQTGRKEVPDDDINATLGTHLQGIIHAGFCPQEILLPVGQAAGIDRNSRKPLIPPRSTACQRRLQESALFFPAPVLRGAPSQGRYLQNGIMASSS